MTTQESVSLVDSLLFQPVEQLHQKVVDSDLSNLLIFLFAYGSLVYALVTAWQADRLKVLLKDSLIPWFLTAVNKSHDYSLLNTYKDCANGYIRSGIFRSIKWSSYSLLYMHLAGMASPLGALGLTNKNMLFLSLFYKGVFDNRLKDSMNSDKSFELGRNFHRFYPMFDDATAFERKRLHTDTTLESTLVRITEKRKSEFLLSSFLFGSLCFTVYLAMSVRAIREDTVLFFLTVLFVHVFTHIGVLRVPYPKNLAIPRSIRHAKSILSSIQPAIWTVKFPTIGPVKVLDDFQRYMSLVILRRPIKSMNTPAFFDDRETFEQCTKISNLEVAHYNHSLRTFSPWAKYLHKTVFKASRKANMSLGESMALVSFWQFAYMATGLALFEHDNRYVDSAIVKLAILFGLQGAYKYMEQDGKVAVFQNRTWRRDDGLKNFIFTVYRGTVFVLELFLYALPLASLYFKGYDLGSLQHS